MARLQPPQAAGREVKLNYATQVEVAPPTFAFFGNHPELIPEHYMRYMHNRLPREVGLHRLAGAHHHASGRARDAVRWRWRSWSAYLVGSIPDGVSWSGRRTASICARSAPATSARRTSSARSAGSGDCSCTSSICSRACCPCCCCPAVAARGDGGWPWGVAFGVAAIVGHVRPVFLLGKGGGKGVATASGRVPRPGAGRWRCAPSRRSSSSWPPRDTCRSARWSGRPCCPWRSRAQQRAATPLGAGQCRSCAAFVFWTHRENIGRLRRGEERRIGRPEGVRAHERGREAFGDSVRGDRRRGVGHGDRRPPRRATGIRCLWAREPDVVEAVNTRHENPRFLAGASLRAGAARHRRHG